MYCSNCGNQVKSEDKFCERCGIYLNNNVSNINSNVPNQNKSTNTSLVLGIIACCLFFIPFISLPLAIIAIILGIINRKEQKITGVILGITSIVLVAVEVVLITLLFNFLIDKVPTYLEDTFDELIEEKVEISGNRFIASDNSIIEFYTNGSYYWSLNDVNNYNKGNYIAYTGTTAYNYAKANLTGFNSYEYDIDDFYLIIMMPTEIMVNGSIIDETNTVYYYGEYESDDKALELYNHNTGNQLILTLYEYEEYAKANIDV